MKKIVKIVVATLVLSMCMAMLVACKDKTVISDEYTNWQTKLKDDVNLIDVVMPGSHDAGTKGMIIMAKTQNHTIAEQLQAGVRYFDIRVKKSGKNLKIFHGPIEGMDFMEVLEDIKAFINKDNGQFLVLDFQHFEKDAEADVAELIKEHLQPEKYAVPDSIGWDLTVGDIRAKGYKYIITWGSKKEKAREYLCYRSDVLYSPYYEDDHKEGGEKLVGETYQKYYETVENNRLFVLQGVVTAKNFTQSIRSNDDKFNPFFDEYLAKIEKTQSLLDKTNIIMRDFIVERQDQIGKIINLNNAKGNFS